MTYCFGTSILSDVIRCPLAPWTWFTSTQLTRGRLDNLQCSSCSRYQNQIITLQRYYAKSFWYDSLRTIQKKRDISIINSCRSVKSLIWKTKTQGRRVCRGPLLHSWFQNDMRSRLLFVRNWSFDKYWVPILKYTFPKMNSLLNWTPSWRPKKCINVWKENFFFKKTMYCPTMHVVWSMIIKINCF